MSEWQKYSLCNENAISKDETMKNNKYKSDESMEERFSWCTSFNKDLCNSIAKQNHTILVNLLCVYIKKVSDEAVEFYRQPGLADKLSNHINRTLTFFYFYWADIKEQCDDQVTYLYLNKISDLLSIYVNLELTSANNATTKLLSTLFIYLDNSTEHVLRVLFNAKLTKTNHQVYDTIFRKCFSKTSVSVTSESYVWQLLGLKLWRSLKDTPEEVEKIEDTAVKLLGIRPPDLPPPLADLLPRNISNTTREWMQQSFDARLLWNDLINRDNIKSVSPVVDAGS